MKIALVIILLAVLALVLLSGCTGRQNPGDYDQVPAGQTNDWTGNHK